MEIIDALILGAVQGLTEFLPVSSSGHLELGKAILGDNALPSDSLLFTVVLHAATALSTVVVFRKDIWSIVQNLFRFKSSPETNLALNIALSTLPAAFVGLFFEEEISALFDGKILFVGAMLIITGLLLFLADRAKKTEKPVNAKNAILIGCAQAIAILPGISRSGATIASGVLLGVDKSKVARFSFLMVLPLIFGKILKDLYDGALTQSSIDPWTLFAGFVAAFLIGILACSWMILLVKKSQLSFFAYYCGAIGLSAILFSLFY